MMSERRETLHKIGYLFFQYPGSGFHHRIINAYGPPIKLCLQMIGRRTLGILKIRNPVKKFFISRRVFDQVNGVVGQAHSQIFETEKAAVNKMCMRGHGRLKLGKLFFPNLSGFHGCLFAVQTGDCDCGGQQQH